jgi:hypothetical protein
VNFTPVTVIDDGRRTLLEDKVGPVDEAPGSGLGI